MGSGLFMLVLAQVGERMSAFNLSDKLSTNASRVSNLCFKDPLGGAGRPGLPGKSWPPGQACPDVGGRQGLTRMESGLGVDQSGDQAKAPVGRVGRAV